MGQRYLNTGAILRERGCVGTGGATPIVVQAQCKATHAVRGATRREAISIFTAIGTVGAEQGSTCSLKDDVVASTEGGKENRQCRQTYRHTCKQIDFGT